jgi:hypothetical protein
MPNPSDVGTIKKYKRCLHKSPGFIHTPLREGQFRGQKSRGPLKTMPLIGNNYCIQIIETGFAEQF